MSEYRYQLINYRKREREREREREGERESERKGKKERETERHIKRDKPSIIMPLFTVDTGGGR